MYDWRLTDIVAVSLYWMGHPGEAATLNRRLLEIVPEDTRSRILTDLEFCETALLRQCYADAVSSRRNPQVNGIELLPLRAQLAQLASRKLGRCRVRSGGFIGLPDGVLKRKNR